MFKDTSNKIGIVEKRLFNGRIYNIALRQQNRGNLELADRLFKLSRKQLFKNNVIWTILNTLLNVDIRIPFVTGIFTYELINRNLITTRGKRIMAERTIGIATNAVTAIAIGIGAVAPIASNTALGSEITTGGGERGAGTPSNQTTTTTGDTSRLVKQFTFTLPFAVTEEGLFDDNVSGGNMLARNTFAPINVIATDIIEITHNVIHN